MTSDFTGLDITIEVDPPFAGEIDSAFLVRVARQVLVRENMRGPVELGVWITNEDELQTLNRTYRGVDTTTDVLSFEAGNFDAAFVHAPEAVAHLGDIAISFPHVVRQAQEFGHSQARELAYLLTHGILHLLGYDHEDPVDARTMREHEEATLGDLGITRTNGSEYHAT